MREGTPQPRLPNGQAFYGDVVESCEAAVRPVEGFGELLLVLRVRVVRVIYSTHVVAPISTSRSSQAAAPPLVVDNLIGPIRRTPIKAAQKSSAFNATTAQNSTMQMLAAGASRGCTSLPPSQAANGDPTVPERCTTIRAQRGAARYVP